MCLQCQRWFGYLEVVSLFIKCLGLGFFEVGYGRLEVFSGVYGRLEVFGGGQGCLEVFRGGPPRVVRGIIECLEVIRGL